MAKRTDTANKATRRATPEFATSAMGISHPFIEVSPPFVLTFDPARWTVIAGKLVPGLQKVPLVAGVNGVEVDKEGRVRFATTRARLEVQGRTVIPYEWGPDGESYIQCLDTRPGGEQSIQETWITVFESADEGADETTPDEEAYADWLCSLVTSGKIPACKPDVARKLLSKSTGRLEKARAEAAKLDGHGLASIRAKALEVEAVALENYVGAAKAAKAKAKAKSAPVLDDAGGAS